MPQASTNTPRPPHGLFGSERSTSRPSLGSCGVPLLLDSARQFTVTDPSVRMSTPRKLSTSSSSVASVRSEEHPKPGRQDLLARWGLRVRTTPRIPCRPRAIDAGEVARATSVPGGLAARRPPSSGGRGRGVARVALVLRLSGDWSSSCGPRPLSSSTRPSPSQGASRPQC